MKIGSISYAIHRGLGYLTKAFYDHGIISDVWVVRHSKIPTVENWYPNARYWGWNELLQNLPATEQWIKEQQFDAMLFFETAYDWEVFEICERLGVRTYMVPMYECWQKSAPKPYKYICPSLLDLDYFPEGRSGVKSEFLTLPTEYPWKLRERALHYVHNGGYLGVRGNREGTLTLIEAMQYVKSPLRLTLRCQENVPPRYQQMMARDNRIEYIPRQVPYEELYATGDVVVGAQRWNGCSLPLQEAMCSGMAIINTDRYPMNTWLPKGGLIPPSRVFKSRISGAYLDFDECEVDPKMLAIKMDLFYGEDITEESLLGLKWANNNSWVALKDKWVEALSK